jgi:hypothetical protein
LIVGPDDIGDPQEIADLERAWELIGRQLLEEESCEGLGVWG